MTRQVCQITNDVVVGPRHSLAILAGPCLLESTARALEIGTGVRDLCHEIDLQYIFKASFDKANRSSIHSERGPGLEAGLSQLREIRDALGVPVTTDIHAPEQAEAVANVVDLIQIPAFLCRQTDLLVAAARTGKPVHVKKGQFLSPAEMTHVVTKLEEAGADNIMLCERGTFFGYHRLVNDFLGMGDLLELGPPICFDATHSTQLPGASSTSGGRPERSALLARAAVAAGVDAIFMECHPDPKSAPSDASNMLPLREIADVLSTCARIRAVMTE